MLMKSMGRINEALAEIRKAQAVDPLSPIIQDVAGITLAYAGRFDEAMIEFDKALKLSPGFPAAYNGRGMVFLLQKRIPEAIADFERVRAKTGDTLYALSNLGYAYARAGRTNEARQIIDKMKKISDRDHTSSDVAFVHLGLGELDEFFRLAEAAVESHDQDPRTWKIEPLLADVLKDPRYAALLKKYGLDK